MTSASIMLEDVPATLGPISLDRVARLLTGPLGVMPVSGRRFLALERLMRRPEALLSRDVLLSAIYPDDEPEQSEACLRFVVTQIRQALVAVCGSAVELRNERSAGYGLIETAKLVPACRAGIRPQVSDQAEPVRLRA